MKKNENNYEAQIALIKDKNINVSSSNDVKDFVILIFGVICIFLIFLFLFEFISNFIISSMKKETQLKIESLFRYIPINKPDPRYDRQLEELNRIKRLIVASDTNLQNSSQFNIYIKASNKANASITPDGSIVITTGILSQKLKEEELAFILAHELGHYSNKDHLKSISKKLATIVLYSATGLNGCIQSIAHGVAETEFLTNSRERERKADLYAGEALIKIYGRNYGGITFLKKLKANEQKPEFTYYFSTHPSLNERYKLLETQQKDIVII